MNAPAFHLVAPRNQAVHEAAGQLPAAIERLDRMGLEITSVEADRRRNRRVLVSHGDACAQLDGALVSRGPGWEVWGANLDGVEVRWLVRHPS